MTAILPLRSTLLEDCVSFHKAFHMTGPLPGFATIEHFFESEALEPVLREIDEKAFETYCVWSSTSDGANLQSGFRQPDEDNFFLSVHQRATSPIASLERLADALGTPACLSCLSELTGTELRELGRPAILTGWGPGNFLGAHADAGPEGSRVKLVISISLTRQWDASYGGSTTYAWGKEGQLLTLAPEFNRAIIFLASPDALHWVSPISLKAPERRRYTWTLHFR